MIGHEAEAEDVDRVLRFCPGEQVEAGGVVARVMKDRRAAIPAIEHVLGVASDLPARNTRHGRSTVRPTRTGRQESVACPLFALFWLPFRVPLAGASISLLGSPLRIRP